MYNLNISGPPLLGVDGVCTNQTPRTPEILNSLIAMTNPLEYSFPSNQQKITQYDSHSSCSESPLDSPAGSNVPPSVQQTCSQLIKAGLKLSLEMKRKLSSGDSSGTEYNKIAKKEYLDSSDDDDDDMDSKSPRCGLTPEDEDRRRRRRERNKIAATKCRMKKRERTLNLVSESEILETQNIELKSQVRSLETERRKLTEMLQAHGATCIRQEGFQPPTRCTIPISKYVPDMMTSSDQTSNRHNHHHHHQQQNKTLPPIPPMNTIKFCHSLNKPTTQNCEQSQSLPDIGYCKSGLSPIYCKSSPSDRYTLSPDSGFIKSPSDMGMYNGMQMKSDYIPNGENPHDGDIGEFALKCELIDAHSPYTTVQSADRFLFDGGNDNFDSDISASRNLKILNNNNNNNNNHLTTTTTVIEFNSSCQSFAESHLLKADFLSQNPELMMDGTETQFTDLDSGVTTYNSIANNANNNSNNNGCMA